MAKINKYRIYCETDNRWEYWHLPEEDSAPTKCPIDTSHTVTPDSVTIVDSTGKNDVAVTNTPQVITTRPITTDGNIRVYSFSIDWTKKETWYHDAIKVNNEVVGVGDGSTTAFNLAHGGPTTNEFILNLTGGLLTDEQFIYANVNPPEPYPTGIGFGYGYSPLVVIDYPDTDPPVPQVELAAYDPGAVGHYTIDHANGVINFLSPPSYGAIIVATYWYVPSDAIGTMKVAPPPGKYWTIDTVEAQFSKDLIMNDVVLQNQFLGDTPVYPLNVEYRNIGSFFDYTFGAHPEIPALGGPVRGTTQPTVILRWEFATVVKLDGDNGDNIRAWLKNGIEFGGERATLTWYAIEHAK